MAKDDKNTEHLQKENDELRQKVADMEAGGRNNAGMPGGPIPRQAFGGQATTKKKLSIGHAGPRGTGMQVVHDANQNAVVLSPGETRDNVEFDSNTADMLTERSENGVGYIVVKGHEFKHGKDLPKQHTRAEIEEAERKNLDAGQKAEAERIAKERPERLGTGAAFPAVNSVTGERSTG